jgi:hypothetical protein
VFFFDWWQPERQQVPVPALGRHIVLPEGCGDGGRSVFGTVTGLGLLRLPATCTVGTVVPVAALPDRVGDLSFGLASSIESPRALGNGALLDGVGGMITHMGWRSTHMCTFSADIVPLAGRASAAAPPTAEAAGEPVVGHPAREAPLSPPSS